MATLTDNPRLQMLRQKKEAGTITPAEEQELNQAEGGGLPFLSGPPEVPAVPEVPPPPAITAPSPVPEVKAPAPVKAPGSESVDTAKVGKDGKINWAALLAPVLGAGIGAAFGGKEGALAGFTVGAKSGAGAMELQREQEFLDEEKAQRDQQRQDKLDEKNALALERKTAQANDAIAKGQWDIAATLIGEMPEGAREEYQETLENTKARVEQEKALKKSEAEAKKIEGALTDARKIAAQASTSEDLKAITRFYSQYGESEDFQSFFSEVEAQAKEFAKKEKKGEQKAYYGNALKDLDAARSVAELDGIVARIGGMEDQKLLSGEQANLLRAEAAAKRVPTERNENLATARNLLNDHLYGEAADYFTKAGISVTKDALRLAQLNPDKFYQERFDSYQRTMDAAPARAQARADFNARFGYDYFETKEKPSGPVEATVTPEKMQKSHEQGVKIITNAALENIRNATNPAEALAEQLGEIDQMVAEGEIPDQATADAIKVQVRTQAMLEILDTAFSQ